MQKAKRWIFNGLATLSLLLCLVTARLWLRCRWLNERIGITSETHSSDIYSQHGYLEFDESTEIPPAKYYREHYSFNINYSIRSRISNMLLVEKSLHRLRLLLTTT
jgi:hypothetical protein